MPHFELHVKMNLENLDKLKPDGDDFRWYLKLKCTSCGESPDHWQYVTSTEKHEIEGSRGAASLVEKCRLCGRQNQLDILPLSIGSYRGGESNLEWQHLVTLECRGLEPTDFDPRIGWKAEGKESGTQFDDISLVDKDWCDYDEKAKVSVGIYEWQHKFVRG